MAVIDGDLIARNGGNLNEITRKLNEIKSAPVHRVESEQSESKLMWEKPTLEDVSEQVTAQPYVRFT